MRRSKRVKAAQAAPGPQEPSLWQEPPAFFVTVLERLLAMPDGTKHVRLASHVCHHWRVAALEVLLADTAISKPPMEDFRAIGQQHPLPPAKCHKQETVTTQAAVVLEASASTGMEAISKQRFDGPPGALAPAVGATGRGRSRSGRPAQAAGARAGAALAPVATQQQQQQQPSPHRLLLQQAAAAQLALGAAQQQQQQQLSPHRQLLQQAAAAQLALGAAQQRQQAPQAQQQASAGPGSTVPAAAAHAAGASPSAQQPGEADVPQGSIQSGMAMIGRRRTAALESESEGGSTRARGPNKRRRARRGSELSGGRGMSVEQPLRLPPAQQVQQQAAEHAARAASGQQAAVQGATAEAAGASRPSSRRRRSVSTAGTEMEGRPSKRQQTSELRRPQRAGLRSSGPASGDGLPDTQHPRSQQHAQQAQQAQEQQQQQQQAQPGPQASGRQRRRSRQPRSEQLTVAQQAQQAEQAQPVQPAGGKLADPFAASGSYHELAEGGAEVEQQVPQVGGEDGENGGPWERSQGAEGGLQAAINVVWRFLRLRD